MNSLDLFSGIGGITVGFENAGINCIGATDIWKEAGDTFKTNMNDIPFLLADITGISPEELLSSLRIKKSDIDIISGGPPCQGFSTVGKRNKNDPRNSLWQHYLDVVRYIRPPYVMIENVEGLNVMRGGGIRDGIVNAFNDIGYEMKHKILVSANYGVPQIRKRMIFIGWLSGLMEPRFPSETHNEENWITVRDAIFDLPELNSGQRSEAYSIKPICKFQFDMRENTTTLHNHEAAKHPEHLIEIISHVPDGGNRKSIPDRLQPKSGFHNSYSRLASTKPAIAVTSNMRKPSSARATHPTQNRGLTVREGLRLQTFKDNFIVTGSRTSQYLQVGNAVPPTLAEAIGRELKKAFDSNSTEEVIKARLSTPKTIEKRRNHRNQTDLFEDIINESC